jgi:hypothetical protein
MQQLTKTQKKIEELVEVMNSEHGKVIAEELAVERLAMIRHQEQALDNGIKAFERHKIWSSVGEIEGDNPQASLERNDRIVASVITAIEFVKTHPSATVDDIRRLGLALPDVMDPGTIILMVRCSKVVERYEAHKARLMTNIFQLVRGAPVEA